MAVFAAVAATAAVSAAPASAQDFELQISATNPCVDQKTVPACIDWSFATAIWAIETGRWTYNNRVQPVLDDAACFVYHTATGQPCPEAMVPTL